MNEIHLIGEMRGFEFFFLGEGDSEISSVSYYEVLERDGIFDPWL